MWDALGSVDQNDRAGRMRARDDLLQRNGWLFNDRLRRAAFQLPVVFKQRAPLRPNLYELDRYKRHDQRCL